MDIDFLENMSVAHLRVDYDKKVLFCQKDEFFELPNFIHFSEFLEENEWLKPYEKSLKHLQGAELDPSKIGKKWVQIQFHPKENYVDVELRDVTRLYAQKLRRKQDILNKAVFLTRQYATVTGILLGLIWAATFWFNNSINENRKQNFILSQELRKTNLEKYDNAKKHEAEIKKRDSVNLAQTLLLTSISKKLQEKEYLNASLAQITHFYTVCEEQRLSLLTDLSVMDYMLPDLSNRLTEIKKFKNTERYLHLKDSLSKIKNKR